MEHPKKRDIFDQNFLQKKYCGAEFFTPIESTEDVLDRRRKTWEKPWSAQYIAKFFSQRFYPPLTLNLSSSTSANTVAPSHFVLHMKGRWRTVGLSIVKVEVPHLESLQFPLPPHLLNSPLSLLLPLHLLLQLVTLHFLSLHTNYNFKHSPQTVGKESMNAGKQKRKSTFENYWIKKQMPFQFYELLEQFMKHYFDKTKPSLRKLDH